VSGNAGAWGVALWRDDSFTQAEGISLEGGDPIVPYLPTDPLGCITLPPDGLGTPGIRNSDVVLAQRDGVAQFEDFYDNRILTFRVTVCNDGCPGCPTGRAKVKRLLREWSRTCRGATLVLFTDCHDPSATLEDRAVTGPFLVRGRPRAGDVTWMRSNFGCANILLRFDARDHRLVILPPENDGDTPWSGVLCEEVFSSAGAEVRTNLAEDPHGRALTWDAAGSTGVITRPTTGGPHNQGYLQYATTVANSSDPMYIHLSGSGVSGAPVVAGESYTVSSYWWMDTNTANDQRYDVSWYTSAGGFISTDTGVDVGIATASTWWRGSETFVAPPFAAFARFSIAWAGTYSTQPAVLRVADALIEHASAEELFFSGAWLGAWSGTADDSTSTTRVERVNYAWDPRGTASSQWDVDGTAGSAYGEILRVDQVDGPEIPGTNTDTYIRWNAINGGAAGLTVFGYEALHVPTEAFEIGDEVTVSVWVRSSTALTSPTVYLSQQVNGADGADVVGAAQAALVPNVWTRLSETLTLTAYADGINEAGLQFPGNTIANGTNVDMGYVLIERAGALGTYFDGTFDEGAWQGAANLSISVLGPEESSLVGTDVTVVGDVCAFPAIVLAGPLTGPITIYYDGNSSVVYSDDVPAGLNDQVTIDTEFLRAYVGSTDVSAALSGVTPSSLPIGTTTITATSGSPLDSGTITVCWENAVISA
jgi:hypothetical protein